MTRTFTLPDGREVVQRTFGETFPFSSGPTKITNVLCSDGTTRVARLSPLGADTVFSTPASVQVRGRTVSGYVTTETLAGLSTEVPEDPGAYKFVAYRYGKNGHLLPGGSWRTA